MSHELSYDLMDKGAIKELRLKLGLSQEGLARKLGVSVLTVRRWERGSSKPSPLALQRIEEVMKETRNKPYSQSVGDE